MGARTASKAEQAIKEIQAIVPDAPVTHIPLDLTSFESIAAAAKAFSEKSDRLDILYNNAGIMATPMGTTKEGYEIQFGTNHMGHFLLTKLLLPTLEKTADLPHADVRIVNVASIGHAAAPTKPMPMTTAELEKIWTWGRYGVSKLSNILHAKELARRHPKVTSVSIHPGVIRTNLYDSVSNSNFIMKGGIFFFGLFAKVALPDVHEGTKNQLWAGTVDKQQLTNGGYYTPIGKLSKTMVDSSDEACLKLWEFSESEVAKKGY